MPSSISSVVAPAPPEPPEGQEIPGTAGVTAIFMVLGVVDTAEAPAIVRGWCAAVPGLVRSMRHRFPNGDVRCVIGFGSDCWNRVFGNPRPAHLHPFEALEAGKRVAPSTPGDILIHLRGDRTDTIFDLATRLVEDLGPAVVPIDEVHGFRLFDSRSMIGFVDGTENPVGLIADEAVFVGAEDPAFAGGSYVLVQKYLHDMDAWNALSIPEQELVIGRTKIDDVELPDEVKPKNSHIALNVITDADGNELKIYRANMPFGAPSRNEYGTYFIGYAHDPVITLTMLSNMFIGNPPGVYDRLLDFSTAVTGTLFFVPSAELLDALAERGPDDDQPLLDSTGVRAAVEAETDDAAADDGAAAPEAGAVPGAGDGSLSIGSLKDDPDSTLLPLPGTPTKP